MSQSHTDEKRPWPRDVYTIVAPRAREIEHFVDAKSIPMHRHCMCCGEVTSLPVQVFEASRTCPTRGSRPLRTLCVICLDQFRRISSVSADQIRAGIAQSYATWKGWAA
ncbi:hypothetical protein Pan44_26420 [Caulifigura coniformis]|uniref:Uncharacterized protein n=1 Tax=Caulifigura coniformis TaxID=2527983 RepID=A0A517SES7_9PLAN|nr:hypothetical protein [Caulifigura coniformis]QDT54608.1 hypothetical protein Pan44_26420 [Caulifigura coniformis]